MQEAWIGYGIKDRDDGDGDGDDAAYFAYMLACCTLLWFWFACLFV